MNEYEVTVTRERHYIEFCTEYVTASSFDEAREKAIEQADNDGCWEWDYEMDGDCSGFDVTDIDITETYDDPEEPVVHVLKPGNTIKGAGHVANMPEDR